MAASYGWYSWIGQLVKACRGLWSTTSRPRPDSDRLCLLFKPGHYDILYANAHAEKVLKLQGTMNLEKRCREPWKCLICFDTEDEAEVFQNWSCPHCICTKCAEGQIGQLDQCLACNAP